MQGQLNVVKNMMHKGFSTAKIVELTGLSEDLVVKFLEK